MAEQFNRIPGGRSVDYDKEISFSFNGRKITGYKGDTIASALLANGIKVVGRSFKYGRPRGVMTASVVEPNAIFQLSSDAKTIPNVRGTTQEIYEGMECNSTNGWPSVKFDIMGIVGKLFGPLMSSGFYYKTFMSPSKAWRVYEFFIRRGAGLGRSPRKPDPDIYDKLNHHVDILVIGAGPSGLSSALAVSTAGARVMLIDEQAELGGSLLNIPVGQSPDLDTWLMSSERFLRSRSKVQILNRTTVIAYHDHNFLVAHERVSDHTGPSSTNNSVRQRLHRIRAAHVILATGAHDRPLVYSNNDLPGCFQSQAIETFISRFGVVPGKRLVLATNNDGAYRSAIAWHKTGRQVKAIVDSRLDPSGSLVRQAKTMGIKLIFGAAVYEARGKGRVHSALIGKLQYGDGLKIKPLCEVSCDTIGTSGGSSPVIHLACHTGLRPKWDNDVIGFTAASNFASMSIIGAAKGDNSLKRALIHGQEVGISIAREQGFLFTEGSPPSLPEMEIVNEEPIQPLFLAPNLERPSRSKKQFVDFQLDVTAAAIHQAVGEGFESIEHVKRYTALGFGTDQGKLGNINGMAIAAEEMRRSISDVGTTVFRPNYTPVSFGSIAGRGCDELFEPTRYTALHSRHIREGALFEDVGQWKRPWYFPKPKESMSQTLDRECMSVRQGVGILDASTLGKIDIQGPDARELLNRVYTNSWSRLPVGRCKYGLMCTEDGMLFDDGVTACLGEQHFLMTTTTGGAARVLDWLENWLQTEWSDLRVFCNSVTDYWATITISGPSSRELLSEITDIELDGKEFSFMDWRQGNVGGIPARVFRISFTGELSYEINVQANYAGAIWDVLMEHGEKFDICPYGTETMHILRAEKGFIIVGQDTDGSVSPQDLGLGWAITKHKQFSFLGERGMERSDIMRSERKQLVGLKTHDPEIILEEGSQLVFDPKQEKPMHMVGHVTSSYFSPILGRSIALALVKGGHHRMGESLHAASAEHKMSSAEICSPIFYDPEGKRQNV